MDEIAAEWNLQWVLVVGFIVAFLLAISVGANDVANPFGTSVGSGALTLLQCFVLATFMETLGAMTMGGAVSDTIRKKIVNIDSFNQTDGKDVGRFMVGQLSAMFGAACWQIMASLMKMPVSGTHSIVGAVIGFALIAKGPNAIQWITIVKIIISWFASPLLSGAMAIGLYYLITKLILQADNRVRRACQFLPFFYSSVVGINCFTILHTMNKIYQWGSDDCYLPTGNVTAEVDDSLSGCFQTWHFASIAILTAVIVFLFIQFLYVPRIRRKIANLSQVQVKTCTSLEKMVSRIERKLGLVMDGPLKSTNNSNDIVICSDDEKVMLGKHEFVNESTEEVDEEKKDGSETPEMRICFEELQAFSASFDAFAHGGNDVGNSIGPVMALWAVASSCKQYGMDSCDIKQTEPPSSWIILYGSAGIILGLWLLGKRVIQTVGKDIANITPARGFSIDIMAGFTVLFGSMLQIPLSTTHCKVGAVVAVSLIHDRSQVSFETFKKIAMAWFVTLPVSAAISALSYYLLATYAL